MPTNPNVKTRVRRRVRARIQTDDTSDQRGAVCIHNDDQTPLIFVWLVLMTVFGKSESEAERIASIAERSQIAQIGVYPLTEAQELTAKASGLARAEGWPLAFSILPI